MLVIRLDDSFHRAPAQGTGAQLEQALGRSWRRSGRARRRRRSNWTTMPQWPGWRTTRPGWMPAGPAPWGRDRLDHHPPPAHLDAPEFCPLFAARVDGHVPQVFDTGVPWTPERADRLVAGIERAGLPFALGLGGFDRAGHRSRRLARGGTPAGGAADLPRDLVLSCRLRLDTPVAETPMNEPIPGRRPAARLRQQRPGPAAAVPISTPVPAPSGQGSGHRRAMTGPTSSPSASWISSASPGCTMASGWRRSLTLGDEAAAGGRPGGSGGPRCLQSSHRLGGPGAARTAAAWVVDTLLSLPAPLATPSAPGSSGRWSSLRSSRPWARARRRRCRRCLRGRPPAAAPPCSTRCWPSGRPRSTEAAATLARFPDSPRRPSLELAVLRNRMTTEIGSGWPGQIQGTSPGDLGGPPRRP